MKKNHYNPLINCRISRRSFRFLTVIIIICFTISTVSSVYASDYFVTQSNLDAITIINAYSDSDVTYSIKQFKQLKSISTNTYEYTFYSLNPYGYAVLLNDNNSLMEACYQEDATIPIDLSDSFTYYYGGPTSYLLSDGNTYIDVCTNHILTEVEIRTIQRAESNVVTGEHNQLNLGSDLRSSTINYNVNQSYFQNLYDFGDNTNNTCTVLAISILLRYYDYFINDDYVATEHHQGTGTADSFHQELIDLVYDPDEDDFGIHISGTANAIDEYLGTRGVTTYLDNDSVIFNTNPITDAIISLLAADKPVVASMSTFNGGSFDHTVVVYGVTYDTSDKYGTAVYRMHTGWRGAHLLTASASWFYQYGSLECYYLNHQYTNYHEYSHTHHRVACDCAAQYTQTHSFVHTALGNKCTKCHYLDNTLIINSVNDTNTTLGG